MVVYELLKILSFSLSLSLEIYGSDLKKTVCVNGFSEND